MSSREKIIAAAIEVFAEKGKHGARMEEIAHRAKINKAMLYYFYNTKENIYRAVLAHILQGIQDSIDKKLATRNYTGRSHAEVIREFVSEHIQAVSQDLNSNRILLEATAASPDDLHAAIHSVRDEACAKGKCPDDNSKLLAFLSDGVSKKILRKIDPKQLLISIIGMNIIYFIAKPISQHILDWDVKDEKKFLKERQESIIDLVLYGIMEKRNV